MNKQLLSRVLQFTFFLLFYLFQLPAIDGQVFSEKINLSDPTQMHILETKRGDRFVGRITKIENTEIYFLFRNEDPLQFKFQDVLRVWVAGEVPPGNQGNNKREEEKEVDPTYYPPEYLLYSATAFNFPKGGGTYRNTDLLWNVVDFGISDNFSFGGGVVIPVLFTFRAKGTFEIAPKFRFGFGQNTFIPFVPDTESASHFFGVASLGQAERFLNFSFGYWLNWQNTENLSLVFTGGGGFNITENWRILIDIFYMSDPDVGVLPSLMLGWSNGKNNVDFGFLNVPETDIVLLPAISYQRRF